MKKLFPLLLLMAMISGCSQAPVVITDQLQASWHAHRDQLMKLNDWSIQGKVGLYTPDEAWPGELQWQQNSDQYDVRIIAPLGAGTLRVFSVEGGVVLEHSSEAGQRFSPDPESLLQQQFGWQIPIRHLRYWMVGLPSPLSTISGDYQLDQQGRLQSLLQSGWKIEFSRYKKTAGMVLPTRVLMEYEDLSVKFIVRKWQI